MPSVVMGMLVPVDEASVGVVPSIVQYVAATPAPLSVGVSVTDCAAFSHALPTAAVESVVVGGVRSTSSVAAACDGSLAEPTA